MQKFYLRNQPHSAGSFIKVSQTSLILLLFLIGSLAHAQQATFFENFDNTPKGGLPEGWTWHQEGGANPNSRWIVSTYGFFGSHVAWSNWNDVAQEGDIDEDWLITPQITPATGDYLIFDAGQEFVWDDFGMRYHVLISTTTAEPAAFTDTLATYTESEFPGYLYSETLKLDLAAYENTPIYIAFVHENPSDNPDFTDDWYLDNVWVRPLQPADLFSAEAWSQTSTPLPIGNSSTQIIIGLIVRIFGDEGTADITSFSFTSEGTTDPSKIKKATLYTTGQDSFIATSSDDDTVYANVFGSIINPENAFEITGYSELPIGDNYFWLVYTLNQDMELEYPYPKADATLEQVIVNDVSHDATVTTIEGALDIVPTYPVNDSIAKAIELGAAPAQYGSYNLRASFESEFESRAYCAPEGLYDVANSIWWHFTAPGDGHISADLSETGFNTILLFLDKNFDQLACNNDINAAAGQVQSKITDFPVTKGQEIYVRVTGMGGPGDPNGEAGVVVLDFAFAPVLGGEDPEKEVAISPLYPNPTSEQASFNLILKKPGEVVIEVLDLSGRSVFSLKEGNLSAGSHTISFDASGIPAGAYMVHIISEETAEQTQKLIISR